MPERRSESPNRITQLIANRREKLMRLAALEGGTTVHASTNTVNHIDPVSDSDKDDIKTKSKTKSRSKSTKIKHGRISRKKCRIRRKLAVQKDSSDTHSDAQTLDVAQPSTSSGLVSRRSRYSATSINNEKHSSSSSDDEQGNEKCRKVKTDSDCSTKVRRLKKWRRKNAVMIKQGLEESHGKQSKEHSEAQKDMVLKIQKDFVNNSNARRTHVEQSVTPYKKKSRCPPTPDSGISGVSTVEKSLEEVQKAWIGGDSSDHEQRKRNLEQFRKKVDVARQSYRYRCNPYKTIAPNTSDSSD